MVIGHEVRVPVGTAVFGDLVCVVECRSDRGDGCYVRRWEAGPRATQIGFAHIPPPRGELQARRFPDAEQAAAAAYRELLIALSTP